MLLTLVATNDGGSVFRCCADSEPVRVGSVAVVAWAIWLAIPVIVTIIAAIVVWWRGRPAPHPSSTQAIRDHQRYLDALGEPARQRDQQP